MVIDKVGDKMAAKRTPLAGRLGEADLSSGQDEGDYVYIFGASVCGHSR